MNIHASATEANLSRAADTSLTAFLETSWQHDLELRLEPAMLTRLFQSSVPILKHLSWTLSETSRGFCKSILPLSVDSSNQHITHQAAVILIAADYTGGVALGSLLHGVPVVGVNPQDSDYGAYLWGAKADIKWIRPSVDDLVCIARIERERHAGIVRRFFQGRRVLETVRIDMLNGTELVAEANITYWVQDTHALRRFADDEQKIHVLFDHRHKTSAKLIAGLRALEHARPPAERLIDDPFSQIAAGKHGLILAQRFGLVAPQLQPMVASRTRHLDDLLTAFHQGRPCQIVNVGAGLDTRILRLPLPPGTKVFDFDLPSMLRRRRELLASFGQAMQASVTELPIDLRQHDLHEVVLACRNFDTRLPTLVIWEGGSMYFDRAACQKILRSASLLLADPESRLWMDYVKPSVFDGSNRTPAVVRFVEAMQCLGEPFVNGFLDIGADLATCGLKVETDDPSDILLPKSDPVFDEYHFCVARRLETKRSFMPAWMKL